MTILDEPSGNQDESSPLKKDVEINNATSSVATAPPPYASIPTPSPNPIPSESSQAIPQTGPQSHRVITFRNRRSPIGRFLAAFGIAWLVLLLWSALVHSFNLTKHFVPVGRRHSYEYEAVRLHSFHSFMLLN